MDSAQPLNGLRLDTQGHGTEVKISLSDRFTLQPEELLWVHIDYSQPEHEQWLRNCDHLDPLAIESLLEQTSRPRCVLLGNNLILDLRGINLNPGDEPDDMVAIRLCIDDQHIISSSRRKLESFDVIRTALQNGKGPTSSGEFIATLTDLLDDRTSDVLEEMEDSFEQLEDDLFQQEEKNLREQLYSLRKQAIRIRRYLAPQKDAINHILAESPTWLKKREKMRLKEHINRISRHLEALDSLRDRAIIAQEELSSRLSEQINSRMYTLSLVATIFMPMSFLTGLLGINVSGIPGEGSSYGFLAVCAIIGVLATLQFFYLRKKKWF